MYGDFTFLWRTSSDECERVASPSVALPDWAWGTAEIAITADSESSAAEGGRGCGEAKQEG